MTFSNMEKFLINIKLFYMPHKDLFRLDSVTNNKNRTVSQMLNLLKVEYKLPTSTALKLLWFTSKYRKLEKVDDKAPKLK